MASTSLRMLDFQGAVETSGCQMGGRRKREGEPSLRSGVLHHGNTEGTEVARKKQAGQLHTDAVQSARSSSVCCHSRPFCVPPPCLPCFRGECCFVRECCFF